MKIVVLAGGISTERTVSLVSGTGVCQALRRKGHQPCPLFILERVRWKPHVSAKVKEKDAFRHDPRAHHNLWPFLPAGFYRVLRFLDFSHPDGHLLQLHGLERHQQEL